MRSLEPHNDSHDDVKANSGVHGGCRIKIQYSIGEELFPKYLILIAPCAIAQFVLGYATSDRG